MKTTHHIWEEKEDFRNYLAQINWDAFLLKAQLVVGGAVLVAILIYVLLAR